MKKLLLKMTDENIYADLIWSAIVENNFTKFVELLGDTEEIQCANAQRQLVQPMKYATNSAVYDLFGLHKILSPFIISTIYGRHEMLAYMLDIRDINVNQHDENGCNALTHMIFSEKIENIDNFTQCARLLLSNCNFNVNDADDWRRNALHHAVIGEKHLRTIKMLLKHERIDVNFYDMQGNTPLLNAANWQRACNVRMLLRARDIHINIANVLGHTALLLCVNNEDTVDIEGSLVCARQLLNDNDINVNYVNQRHSRSYKGAFRFMTAMLHTEIECKWPLHALLMHGRI
jgi:ankyrin repeat protein